MSDGPHLALPIGARWRRVAGCFANPSYGVAGLAEEVAAALRTEIPKRTLDALRSLLLPRDQGLLFLDDATAALEAVRRDRPGCATTSALVGCAMEALERGATPAQAFVAGVDGALRDAFDARVRGMEEHYRRDAGPERAVRLRDRFDEVREVCGFGAVAAGLLAAGERGAARKGVRRTGIEDGPALPS